MKKIFLFLGAVVCAMSLSAETVTLQMSKYAATSFSAKGVNVKAEKGGGQTAPAYVDTKGDLRVYANGKLTISSSRTITAISFEISEQGQKRLASITTNGGTCTVKGTPDFSVKWSGSSNSVVFTVGEKATYGTDGNTKAGQLDFTAITVTLEGEGSGDGDGDGEGEGSEIAGLAYADAYYYAYEGVNYWDFDLYADFDWEEFTYVYPELYLCVKAKSATKIAGTYTLDYAGLWRSATDSVEIDEAGAVLTISYVDVDTYKFEGQFLADDGQTYSFSSVVELYATDEATGEDIILEDDGSDQAVENAEVQVKATKTIKEGMLIIEKNNHHYNVLGQRIR